MKYSLLILGSPFTSEAGRTALNFSRALLRADHSIYRIFFYQDGIHQTSAINSTPQGELDLPKAWRAFVEENDIDAVTCIAAAARRGMVDQSEQQRHELANFNLANDFELSGLGQLVEATIKSDRLMTFGA